MKISLLIVFLFSFGFIHGQLVTDRPDQTESSSTVGKGNLQLESGVLFGFNDDGISTVRQLALPSTLIRFGLFEGLELRLVSQFESLKYTDRTIQGINDLELGLKLQLLQGQDLSTEIAFLSHVILPTGSKDLTGNSFGTVNKLAVSHELSWNVGLGYNIGYNYFGDGRGDVTYSLALGVAVNDKVGIYIEPYGEWVNFEDFVLDFNTGISYLLNENLQFDFSLGTGINHRMNYLALGVSWLALSND